MSSILQATGLKNQISKSHYKTKSPERPQLWGGSPPLHATPGVAHHQVHQVLQVLPVLQAAVQAHHRAAQVHRQAVPAQAGMMNFKKWSI